MNTPRKPPIHRELIDALVRSCKEGQGQIGTRRARSGVWNQSATPDFIPEQHAINLLLKRMSPADREILAGMLAEEVVTGVFDSLKLLEQFQIEPFKDG